MSAVFDKLNAAVGEEARKAAAAEVAASIKAAGVTALKADVDKLKAALEQKDAEAGLFAFTAICETVGPVAEAYLLPLLPIVLEKAGDKAKNVAAAGDAAGKAYASMIVGASVPTVLPAMFAAYDTKTSWQTKITALTMLSMMNQMFPKVIAKCLPDIVPQVSQVMSDAKIQVKELSHKTLLECCANVGNRDIEGVIPDLVGSIANPTEVQECVHKLAATTFVQQVEAPALAILVPLLLRGLRERVTAIKRKSALIIDNMSKLVDNPADATVFLPRLLPEVEKVSQDAADPELRSVAARAHATLTKVGEGAKAVMEAKKVEPAEILAMLKEEAATAGSALSEEAETSAAHAAAVCTYMIHHKNFEAEEWKNVVSAYLAPFVKDTAAVAAPFLDRCRRDDEKRFQATAEEEEEGVDLCNCEFSLAYGAKILLNNATLRLKRGKRYGLCGPNGVGKSTLMRAIANGQVDGFPPKTELRTVYVEHDIDASMTEVSAVDFVFADAELQEVNKTTREQIEKALADVGFNEELRNKAVGSLSGGWKMKLALARAMLMNPDILLLDEPTNHLDVHNVAWLEKYLTNLATVSSIIVSHDSGFLDHVCTHIIHYENRKLKVYRGNLSCFVKVVPEAQAYYSLEASQQKFTLPEPGYLEGVKTKDKAILKVEKVSFKYPGTERLIFENATGYCTLSSRIAILGPNGAGKSTLVKVMCGEMEPTIGNVWRHPNLRIAYVAQHAFHHIEQHLDKTPNEYIQWRFAIGEDREALEKVDRKMNDDDMKALEQKFVINGQKLQVEKLLGRRKQKKSYEYEVQWVGQPIDKTTWMAREDLEKAGLSKLVNEVDMKEAAAQGLHQRPLTTASIQKHLQELGLEPEFSTHSRMRGLSGGQKVKVVLAAATWLSPHMVVLDEPTNYLDRDSLGALAHAIKEYGGGVIMITHHNEFSSALCPETWTVNDGKVVVNGANYVSKEKVELKQADEIVDAFGNVVKVKQPKKKLSNKEKKALQKLRQARRERGEEVTDSEEDDS